MDYISKEGEIKGENLKRGSKFNAQEFEIRKKLKKRRKRVAPNMGLSCFSALTAILSRCVLIDERDGGRKRRVFIKLGLFLFLLRKPKILTK